MTDKPTTATCLLCGGRAGGPRFPYATQWNGKRFDHLACTGCGATFIDPVPSSEDFAAMYAQESYHDIHYATEEDTTGAGALIQVASHLKAGGRLLDYGCGNGAFLKQAAAAGYDACGIELDERTIERAAALSGCPVLPLDQALAERLRFDVIHLGDVLEHLPDPSATLRTLDGLLTPGGRYFVEGPLEDNPGAVLFASRAFGFAKRWLKPHSAGSFVPYHLTRVSARQLRRFFSGAGYETIHFATSEDGWPYRSLAVPAGGAARVRNLIGKVAIASAAAGQWLSFEMGNRFVAILRKAEDVSQAS